MHNSSRRDFLKKMSVTPFVAAALPRTAKAEEISSKIGSYIDLTLCDGCKDLQIPLCVKSCKDKNSHLYPEPQLPIPPYWPRKNFEDHSKNREDITQLSPYNWTFIEKVNIDGENIYIPRRCMHCDNPTCLNLCPFGTIHQTKEGAVKIEHDFCMGGAKCRDVCPWNIPQRQAGVGIYLKLAPKLGGGGIMYKCDGCADLLSKQEKPLCEVACPKNAIVFGDFETIKQAATKRASEINGYLYGLNQNGGTKTIYISKIPFEKIDDAITKDKTEKKYSKHGRPNMKVDIKDSMEDSSLWLTASMIAPIAGIATAAITTYKFFKGKK